MGVEPLVLDQVGTGSHAERAGGRADEVGQALRIGRLGLKQFLRNGPLGQIVDAPPASPADADRSTGVEQPLGGDLHLRPVPPGAAGFRAAELGRGQRPLVAQPRENLRAGLLADLVPALALGRERAPSPGVVRPVLDRQDARGMRPVLEGLRPARQGLEGGTPQAGRQPPCCQKAASTASRPTGPSRAYATSSCDRASTEIVSSCTALTRRSIPGTPPRLAAAPRNP